MGQDTSAYTLLELMMGRWSPREAGGGSGARRVDGEVIIIAYTFYKENISCESNAVSRAADAHLGVAPSFLISFHFLFRSHFLHSCERISYAQQTELVGSAGTRVHSSVEQR
jgi:hypothetical protein